MLSLRVRDLRRVIDMLPGNSLVSLEIGQSQKGIVRSGKLRAAYAVGLSVREWRQGDEPSALVLSSVDLGDQDEFYSVVSTDDARVGSNRKYRRRPDRGGSGWTERNR